MMSSDNDSSAASDGNDLRDDELGRMIVAGEFPPTVSEEELGIAMTGGGRSGDQAAA